MKAWLLDGYTGIAGIRLGDAPEPKPGPGEVTLQVAFAGLNPADKYLAERQYPARPTFPHILGRDGAGTVVEVGPGVDDIKVGDRRLIIRTTVGGDRPGTFAERVSVPVDSLAPVPDGWTFEEAGGASLVCLTAYQALTMWGALPQKSVVLVTGASGGVGVAATHLASAMGMRVVALSRDEAKRARLCELGAEITLDPNDAGWRSALRSRLAPESVQLAIDSIGGKLLTEVIDILGQNAAVSLVGRLAGPVPNFNTATLFFRRLRLGGVAVGTYTAAEAKAAWDDTLRLMGSRRPVVDSVFSFEDLPRAFERLASGPMGKVLLSGAGLCRASGGVCASTIL
jgi:NADPH2:quinone reductase